MKNYFRKMAEQLNMEIYDLKGIKTYGLEWGQGKIAKIKGFKRKDMIKALNWADNHSKEAEEILTEVYTK